MTQNFDHPRVNSPYHLGMAYRKEPVPCAAGGSCGCTKLVRSGAIWNCFGSQHHGGGYGEPPRSYFSGVIMSLACRIPIGIVASAGLLLASVVPASGATGG